MDICFEMIDWETELLSKTLIGWFLLRDITDVITCKWDKQEKQKPNHQTIVQAKSVNLIEVFHFN